MSNYGTSNPYGSWGLGTGGGGGQVGPFPVASGQPSYSPLTPAGTTPVVLQSLQNAANMQGPYIQQEQQLANQEQNLNPNASVGKNLWNNQIGQNNAVNAGLGNQISAYNQAQAYANGAPTAAQTQLASSQTTSNAMGQGAALGAGGGARGAAAAQGALQDQAGSTIATQGAQRAGQKAADQATYTQQAAQLGNQLLGSQVAQGQNTAQWQNSQGQLQGQYGQLGDTASLTSGSMLEGMLQQNLGLGYGSAQQGLQNAQFNTQLGQKVIGGVTSGVGNGLTQYGNSSGGGAPSTGSPYGLGNNSENPWYDS